jgi:DNA helicase IV
VTLRLPALEELSREQEEVIDLPLDGSYLVTGPPGTGKTVMAIYRAGMLNAKGEQARFLMYNNVLSDYTAGAVKSQDFASMVSTYHSWFGSFYVRICRAKPPMADRWKFDWTACLVGLMATGMPPAERRHLLVDEGQDMPKEFYAVVRYVGKTVTVFADENQRIMADNSTLAEIADILGIREARLLTMNYRNTARIAEVAAHFHAGIQTGVSAVPSDRNKGEMPALIYHDKLHQAVDFIVNWEKLHGDQTIGVLVPYQNQQIKIFNRLKGKTRHPVGIYVSGDDRYDSLDFTSPGIKIVNFQSAKGLEFDTVFLPELQDWNIEPSSLDFQMKMFVMTSRARDMLFFMYTGAGMPAILGGLPLHLLDDRRK